MMKPQNFSWARNNNLVHQAPGKMEAFPSIGWQQDLYYCAVHVFKQDIGCGARSTH